jgi:hypothetical protein
VEQETPFSWIELPPEMPGVLWIVQLEPFQVSTSAFEPVPVDQYPTATQDVVEVQ